MKIDTAAIPGYAEMSAEEKLAALEGFEYEDHSADAERMKSAVSKANSEAAEWKRKHNALLSDDEKKTAEVAERYAEMERQLAELQKEKLIAGHRADFLAAGYPEELAVASAEALAAGDTAAVFANLKSFAEHQAKAIKAELLKSTPKPPAGSGSSGADYNKRISEARARGDMATVAALMRQQQESIR